MKKIVIFLFLTAIITAACNTSRLSFSGNDEKAFVEKFVKYMVDDNVISKETDYDGMMDCISPKYLKANKINVAEFKVNNYSVHNFSIETYNREKSIITVKIWGIDKKWIHRVDFMIVKEHGKLYLFPSKHSDSYIDPWQKVDSYIQE
jgi:hypothetical protein